MGYFLKLPWQESREYYYVKHRHTEYRVVPNGPAFDAIVFRYNWGEREYDNSETLCEGWEMHQCMQLCENDAFGGEKGGY